MITEKVAKSTENNNFKLVPGAINSIIFNPIWKICSNLKCSIVGVCLTIAEQRRILKKEGLSFKREVSLQVHEIVMGYLDKENKVSAKVDLFIKHKYRKDISKHKGFTEEQLKEAWQNGLRIGKIEGLFYLIATRSDISEEFLFQVYGDVHMLSHINIEETMKSRRSLYVELNVNSKLSTLLNKEKLRIKKLTQKNIRLAKSLEDVCFRGVSGIQKQIGLVAPNNNSDVLKAENLELKYRVKELEVQIQNASKQNSSIEREKRKLHIKMFELQSTNSLLVDEVTESFASLS